MSPNNPRWCQSNKKVKNKNLVRIFLEGGSVNQAILGQNFVNSIHLENTHRQCLQNKKLSSK